MKHNVFNLLLLLFIMKPFNLAQLSNIDLRLLKVFRVVVETRGISAAELELNIGRSTISRHIKELESRLGVTLCHRGRGGFSLTSEGQIIFDSSLRLIAAMNQFRHEVNELNKSISGNLVLSLFDKTVSNPNCYVHQAISMFDEIAPEVTIDINVGPINQIESGIMEGRYHIGIVPEHRASSSLCYHRLFKENMHLYCGRDHSLFGAPLDHLTHENIINYKYAGLGYHSPNMQVGSHLKLQRHATVYDQEAVVTLLLSGRYIGFLPSHYAKSFVDQGLLSELLHKDFSYNCEFSAIYKQSPKPSRIVAKFLDCLIQVHKTNKMI